MSRCRFPPQLDPTCVRFLVPSSPESRVRRSMGWDHLNPYEYHPERGLYYHEVFPNLLCGSQPQTPADIEQLHAQERVTNIVNLQACLPTL